MKLIETCPYCTKQKHDLHVVSESVLASCTFLKLSCGHTVAEMHARVVTPVGITDSPSPTAWSALDTSGHAARPYQIEAVRFFEHTNFKALLADEMGVGKTLSALMALRHNEQLFPVAILVKSSTIYQWAKEFVKWVSPLDGPRTVIPVTSRKMLIPGLAAYIMSHDQLARGGDDKTGSTIDKLLACGIKTIIVDECHSFKDPSAARTKALITLITRGEIQNRIFLSGTPIKSRASEYFTVLNLIDPRRFSSRQSFYNGWLIPNERGSYSRIAPWKADEFQEVTSKYILRRMKHEVLKDLPPFTLNTETVVIDDLTFKKLYNHNLDLFSNFLNGGQALNSTELLGWLARLRRITGKAKISHIVEKTREFFDSHDSPELPKLAIGIHHEDVREALYTTFQVEGLRPLQLSGMDNPARKEQIVQQFTNQNYSPLIANALAGGVGLNIQCCHDAWLMERQWTPSDENQWWARFHRSGQEHPVTGTVFEAKGTIDQFFGDLLREKFRDVSETMGDWSLTTDDNSLRQLAETVSMGRL